MAIEAIGVPIATPMGQILGNFLLVTVTLSLFIYLFIFWFETTTNYQYIRIKNRNNNKNKEITSRNGQPSAQDKLTDYAIKNSTQKLNLISWPLSTKI